MTPLFYLLRADFQLVPHDEEQAPPWASGSDRMQAKLGSQEQYLHEITELNRD
jgi:hypothetical protein